MRPRCLPGADRGNSGATQAEIDAALQKKSSITSWTWSPQAEDIVAAFDIYPKIDVKLENVGTGNDHYLKLENAIKAGEGAPDGTGCWRGVSPGSTALRRS